MKISLRYGYYLAVIYAIIWFVDLLDASILNVALPTIARLFSIQVIDAEWVLIGFLLAMTIGMVISYPLGSTFGNRRIFLLAQWIFIVSSLGCGFSFYFGELVAFRILQGFGGGLAIPIGMTMVIHFLPQNKWVKSSSWINFFSLVAPAIGPILAGYITTYLNWRWLFFAKLPLSLICVLLSHIWVKKMPMEKERTFDWIGFFLASISLSLTLLVLSDLGKPAFSNTTLILFTIIALSCGITFFVFERKVKHPLVPIKIFKYPHFSWGNLIQSAANMIFLGATFIIALYLQRGLGFSIVKTGWIMASITLGMAFVMPLTGKFYNRIGPLPFIIPSLIVMGLSMFALIFIHSQTSPFWIGLIIFCTGAGSAALQTTNFASIFCEIPPTLKGPGSSLYSIFKQMSATFGIALSTMILTIYLDTKDLHSVIIQMQQQDFYPSLIMFGLIPFISLLCCFKIDNQKALKCASK